MTATFRLRSRIPASAERLWRWHARPGALERLTPPWESAEVVSRDGGIADGARVVLRVPFGPLRATWVAEHRDVRPGRSFRDVQVSEAVKEPPADAGGVLRLVGKPGARRSTQWRELPRAHGAVPRGSGRVSSLARESRRDSRDRRRRGFLHSLPGPFARFEHEHRIDADGPGAAFLEDRIEYALPLGALGRILAGRRVARRLERAFAWRHETLREDVARHAAAEGVAPMRIVVTGASGLVGSALVPFLTTGGHEVVRAVRGPSGTGEVRWSPEAGFDPTLLAGAEAVVHLAGEGIANARWNTAVKERIRTSRVDGTRALAESIARASPRPRTLVVASAVGFYGDRGEEPVDETSPPGSGFLCDVASAWEAAAAPAREAGVRVVHLRFGVVLSAAGGALRKMLLPFRLGVGGVIGSGAQRMPWISIDDAVGAVHHVLVRGDVSGPVNVTAPEAATNREFTKTLGRVLGRPTIFPMPAFAARIAFGEMAGPLLLTGQRVVPMRLAGSGFRWRHGTLEGALRHVLGR